MWTRDALVAGGVHVPIVPLAGNHDAGGSDTALPERAGATPIRDMLKGCREPVLEVWRATFGRVPEGPAADYSVRGQCRHSPLDDRIAWGHYSVANLSIMALDDDYGAPLRPQLDAYATIRSERPHDFSVVVTHIPSVRFPAGCDAMTHNGGGHLESGCRT